MRLAHGLLVARWAGTVGRVRGRGPQRRLSRPRLGRAGDARERRTNAAEPTSLTHRAHCCSGQARPADNDAGEAAAARSEAAAAAAAADGADATGEHGAIGGAS